MNSPTPHSPAAADTLETDVQFRTVKRANARAPQNMRSQTSQLLLSLAVMALSLRLHGADPKPAPGPFEGTWKWSFTMSDGTRAEPKAKLKQDGDTITGFSIVRSQPTPIRNGKVVGDTISWSVQREHEGQKATTRYQGKLVGDVISGFIESDWAGEIRRYEWEARRVPNTPAGTWRWTLGRRGGGGRGEAKATFKVDGHKVTGKITGFGRDLEIQNGKFADGEFSFRVVRERDGNRSVTHYSGKLEGDTIKGQAESGSGEVQSRPWEATRIED